MFYTPGKSRNLIFQNDAIIAPKQRLAIENFKDGYIDELDINMIPLTGLYGAANVIFDTLGAVKTRDGLDPLLVTVPGAKRYHSMFMYEVAGSAPKLCAGYEETLAYVDPATDILSNIATGITNTDGLWDGFSFNGDLYIMTKSDAMRVYDGSTVWNAGLTAPSTALTATIFVTAPEDKLTAAAGAGTGLTGGYKYKVTFVNASGESSCGPDSEIVTVSNKDISLSNIPIGPAGTTARKIYRTKAYGIVYYLVTTISDNTTKTYTDSTADTSLGAEPPDDYNLTGKFIYRVSFVYGDRGESAPGPASTVLEVNKGKIALSDIPIGGSGCTKRKLYRTEADGADETQRLCYVVNDNVTTTYTDNINDSSLTTQIDVISRTPPNFTFGLFKKKSSTLWAVDTTNYPNRIYICEANYPEVCKTDSWIDLPNSDEIICLVEYFDDTYVLCKYQTFRITGETLEGASVSVISQSVGAAARNTVKHVRQDLVFLSYNGLFTLSRVLLSSNANTVDVKPLSERVGKKFDSITWQYAYKAWAETYKDWYFISFPIDNATENNYTFAFNIANKNWAPQTGVFGQISCYAVGDIENTNNQKLYCGSSSQNGKLYLWPGLEYNDDGQAIDSYIITSIIDANLPECKKRWKLFSVEVELSGDWDLHVWYRKKPYTDLNIGWIEKLIDLNPGYSVSGGDLPSFWPVTGFYPIVGFGVSFASETVIVDTKSKNISANSKYLQFKIGNNAQYNEYFKLFNIAVYYRIKEVRAT